MRTSGRFLRSLPLLVPALGACLAGSGCGGGGAKDFTNSSLVSLSTASVPPGATGQPYAAQLTANFPHPPGQFVVSAGRLPPGVELDNLTGEITGFPRQMGRFNFEVSARDGVDPTLPPSRDVTFSEAVKPFALEVGLGAPNILPQVLPAAQYRHSFLYQVDVAGGTPPYVFSLEGGALPTGITLHPSGLLGNFPTQANVAPGVPFEFDVKVTDAANLTDTAHFSLNVVVLPLIILTSSLDEAAQDFPYDAELQLASAGGGQPITWTQAPPTGSEVSLASIGMEITADGHVRNSIAFPGPTTLGTHTFTIQVTDEAGQVATRGYSLKVNPGPVLSGITPNRASVTGPYFVNGANFQPGAVLVFKPGPTEVTVTPTFLSPTQLRFNTSPSAPGGTGGGTAVEVRNPDGGTATKSGAFVFPATTLSFGAKGFLASNLSSTGLACADVDGDGWADLVHSGASGVKAYSSSATSTSAGLIYHHNLGTATPTFSSQTLSASNFYDVRFADVNLDGRIDVVALGQTSISVFLNGVSGNPLGTFSAGPVSALPGGFTYPSAMTMGKLDADGIPDVAFCVAHYPTSSSSGRVYTMKGDGSGGFTIAGQATTTIPSTNGVARLCACDSDGDGRDEICAGIGCNPYSGPIFNYNPLNADASFAGWAGRGGSITSPGYGVTTGLVAGDFLGTGTPVVLGVLAGAPSYSNTRAFRLFSGAGLGTMLTLPTPSATTKDLAGIDADFDSKLDWAVSTAPSTIQVYRGSTQASVTTLDAAVGSPAISSPLTGKLGSGDLDNDGRPDLVATTSSWIAEGMAIYIGSSTYKLGTSGDGGSKGIVFFLNSSN